MVMVSTLRTATHLVVMFIGCLLQVFHGDQLKTVFNEKPSKFEAVHHLP
jgi:hypothetical protein